MALLESGELLSMRIRRFASVLGLSLTLFLSSGFEASVFAAQNEQTSAGLIDAVHTKLGELIGEYFKKAKITKSADQIKVEYKVRPFVAVGNRQELAPDFGGVMCEIDLKPGPYSGKVRLPQQYNEHNFYSVILMAPYSKALNAHLYTKLLYPSDTPQDFTDRFKELLNEFDDGHVVNAAPAVPQQTSKTSTSTPEETKIDTPKSKQFFWKATRGNDVAFILGTIPFRQASTGALTMANEVKDAYKESKSIIVDTIDLRTTLPYSDKNVRYPSGDGLSKHLSESSRHALDAYLKWSGENMDMYEFWKPWFAAQAFETSLYRLNGFVRVDWEKYIADRAKKDAKTLQEIESAEGKISLFDTLPADVQDRLLTLSIKELMGFENAQREVEAAWRAGDTDKLEKAINFEADSNPDLKSAYDKVLEERTNRISKKVDEELKNEGPVFVAVDARNLVGAGGLVSRLTQKGFTLEQISGSNTTAKGAASADEDAPKTSFGGKRLSRYTYPEGKFSILLPGKPAMRFTNKTGMRQVEYIYQDTQGAYCVGYIILPGEPVPSAIPSAFDATAKGLTASYHAIESKESQASLQGYPGRIINITKLKDKTDWGVHVRMFVIGKMLYILAAEGTTAWLRSPIVNEVSNSLRVTTPQDEAKNRFSQYTKAPTQPWTGTTPADPIRRPQANSGWGSSSSSRDSKTKWGADPFGQVSPYQREKNKWGRD